MAEVESKTAELGRRLAKLTRRTYRAQQLKGIMNILHRSTSNTFVRHQCMNPMYETNVVELDYPR